MAQFIEIHRVDSKHNISKASLNVHHIKAVEPYGNDEDKIRNCWVFFTNSGSSICVTETYEEIRALIKASRNAVPT